METLSFTIPNIPSVLRAVARALLDEADPAELPFPDPATAPEIPFPADPVSELLAGQPDIPPAPPAAPVAPVALDVDGLPWDARIHTSARTQLKRGSWKLMRGVSPELVSQVHAELRDALSGAPEALAAPAAPMTLGDLMLKITESDVTSVLVQEALAKHDVPSLPVLGSTRPDLIPVIAAELFNESL